MSITSVAGSVRRSPQHLPQRGALDVLHHDVRRRLVAGRVLAVVVDLGDPRMVQHAGQLRLRSYPGPDRLVGAATAQHLHRDGSVEQRVVRQPDGPDAAGPDQLMELVAAVAQGVRGIHHA
nr:hypothetical protein [Nocardioides ungokensis]